MEMKPITKAVIPAAGLGTRFFACNKSLSKGNASYCRQADNSIYH